MCLIQHLLQPSIRLILPLPALVPPQSHQFVFGIGEVRLLVAVIVGRPAVGHQEVEDGRVVGDLRSSPAHHQSTAVHMLHLHVDGSAAAYWEEGGGSNQRKEKKGARAGEMYRKRREARGREGWRS